MNNLVIDKKSVIVLGSGGHAKVLIEMLWRSGISIIGVVSPNENNKKFMGVEVLGGDEVIDDYSENEVMLVNGLGSLPGKMNRWLLANKFRQKGFHFMTVVDSHAVVARDVLMGEGVQVMAGTVIQPNVEIGMDTIINTHSSIDHDCKIEHNCHLAPGVTVCGGVRIGNNVHISTGTSIIQGVSIGSNSTITAGSVVVKDVDEGVIINQYKEMYEKF